MYRFFTDTEGREFVIQQIGRTSTMVPLFGFEHDLHRGYRNYQAWLAEGNVTAPDDSVEDISDAEKIDALLEGGTKLDELKARIAARKL